MDHHLLGGLVHRKQPDQPLEGLPALLALSVQHLGEEQADPLVLAQQQVDDVLLPGLLLLSCPGHAVLLLHQ